MSVGGFRLRGLRGRRVRGVLCGSGRRFFFLRTCFAWRLLVFVFLTGFVCEEVLFVRVFRVFVGNFMFLLGYFIFFNRVFYSLG